MTSASDDGATDASLAVPTRARTARRLRGSVAVALAALALAMTGCSTAADAPDAAGMTREQVAELSLQDEFRLAGKRYEQGQALLAEAQRQISDGTWLWNGGDVRPLAAGGNAFGEAPDGATTGNSYFFRAARIIERDGASGAAADLEPMQRYFDDKGWRSGSAKVGTDLEVRADTGDGWWVTWSVRPNGQSSIGVHSEAFWTNDTKALVRATSVRDPATFPDASKPGVSEPFPEWSDPVRR